jgi:DNA-binding MarR family transcriptional regulator
MNVKKQKSATSDGPDQAGSPSIERRVLSTVGREVLTNWTRSQREAYFTFLEMTLHVKIMLDDLIMTDHGLTIGMAGILGELVNAEHQRMRLTDLAGAVGLSPSRITRLVAALEKRGLVAKIGTAEDSRVTHAMLTKTGQIVSIKMQASIRQVIEREFFDLVGECDLADIARIFTGALGRRTMPLAGTDWEKFEIG